MRNGQVFSFRTFPATNPYINADVEFKAFWSCAAVLTTGPTISISGTTVTVTPGVWSRGSASGQWARCGLDVTAGSNMNNAMFNAQAYGCEWLYSVAQGFTFANATTLNTSSSFYTYGMPNNNPVTIAGYKLVWVENVQTSPYAYANSACVNVSAGVAQGGPGSPANRPLTAEQAKNQIKPLPTIVQPLVAALPALSKPLVDAGGKVDLKAGDFTGLVSASISGKPLDITVGSTGSLSLTVPSGQAGTTANLLLNFKSGTVILQDAIKYVAPVVVSQVPVRFVSIKAGAKNLSPAAADSVRLAAFANLKNNSIECVAYAASAATADAAKATAQQACDLAVKSNPDLVNTSVVVVIDKIKAATQGVGIRVYKQ
jgi:hypothetical protein